MQDYHTKFLPHRSRTLSVFIWTDGGTDRHDETRNIATSDWRLCYIQQ